jgi:WD40 repeat protein
MGPREFAEHSTRIPLAAFSPDGKLLASALGNGEMLQLASPSTGEPVRFVGTQEGEFTSLTFSPDGGHLAAGTREGWIHVWAVTGGRPLHSRKAHTGGVWALAFSADGKSLASGGEDKAVRLWETATGNARRRLDGHAAKVLSVAFAPDGLRLASGGADGTALLWDLRVSAR